MPGRATVTRMRSRRLPVTALPLAAGLLVAAGLGVLAGCGDDGGEASNEQVPENPDAVVVAQNMAFDPEEVHLAAGRPATIVIDNRDDGVNHNIHLEHAPEPDRTPLEAGRSQQALTVELDRGEYTFVCDLHPNMEGKIVAE
jgi:plastocyanin